MQSFERPLSRKLPAVDEWQLVGRLLPSASRERYCPLLTDHELPNAQLRSCHSGRGKRTVAWPRMRQQEVVMLSAVRRLRT